MRSGSGTRAEDRQHNGDRAQREHAKIQPIADDFAERNDERQPAQTS